MDLSQLVGFEWDEANQYKNEQKHGGHWSEIEEVFFNRPLLLQADIHHFTHSTHELRCFVLGKTDAGRQMMVVFTIGGQRIRVISARPMSRKERAIYEQAQANSNLSG